MWTGKRIQVHNELPETACFVRNLQLNVVFTMFDHLSRFGFVRCGNLGASNEVLVTEHFRIAKV